MEKAEAVHFRQLQSTHVLWAPYMMLRIHASIHLYMTI
jgi:hypothetical protein